MIETQFLECPDCEQPEAVEIAITRDGTLISAAVTKVYCGCELDGFQKDRLQVEALEITLEQDREDMEVNQAESH